MTTTTTTVTTATIYDHAQRIARGALKGMTTGHVTANGNFTGTGYTGKTAELRRDINVRDRRTMSQYNAIDNGTTVYDDNGQTYYGTLIDDGELVKDMPTTLSDSMDIVQTAALAIIEALPNIDHDIPYALPDNVAKAAFKAVHAYIYSQQSKPIARQNYIEDMSHSDNGEITDKAYIRVTRYYDVDCYTEYEAYQSTLNTLKPMLTINQRTILHKRLQGYSVSAIADSMHVSHQAISKQLAKIQSIANTLLPDETRGFKAARNYN